MIIYMVRKVSDSKKENVKLYNYSITHTGQNEFLACFSPARNCRKLFMTQTSSSGNDELSCVHGIRVLTICWIIMGHTLDWNNLNVYRKRWLKFIEID